jgi:hypothetical protein
MSDPIYTVFLRSSPSMLTQYSGEIIVRSPVEDHEKLFSLALQHLDECIFPGRSSPDFWVLDGVQLGDHTDAGISKTRCEPPAAPAAPVTMKNPKAKPSAAAFSDLPYLSRRLLRMITKHEAVGIMRLAKEVSIEPGQTMSDAVEMSPAIIALNKGKLIERIRASYRATPAGHAIMVGAPSASADCDRELIKLKALNLGPKSITPTSCSGGWNEKKQTPFVNSTTRMCRQGELPAPAMRPARAGASDFLKIKSLAEH